MITTIKINKELKIQKHEHNGLKFLINTNEHKIISFKINENEIELLEFTIKIMRD